MKVAFVFSAGVGCEGSVGSHINIRLALSDEVAVDTVLSTLVDSDVLRDVAGHSIISEVMAIPSNSVDSDVSRDVAVDFMHSEVLAVLSGSVGSGVANGLAMSFAFSDVASVSVDVKSFTRSVLNGVVLDSGVSDETPSDSITSEDKGII